MLCNLCRQQVVPPGVNSKMVKMDAPDLFPSISLLNKLINLPAIYFPPSLRPGRKKSSIPLKMNVSLPMTPIK